MLTEKELGVSTNPGTPFKFNSSISLDLETLNFLKIDATKRKRVSIAKVSPRQRLFPI